MNNYLWTQHSQINPNSTVMQCAESEYEAKQITSAFPFCPWFKWELQANNMKNPDGPFMFDEE